MHPAAVVRVTSLVQDVEDKLQMKRLAGIAQQWHKCPIKGFLADGRQRLAAGTRLVAYLVGPHLSPEPQGGEGTQQGQVRKQRHAETPGQSPCCMLWILTPAHKSNIR